MGLGLWSQTLSKTFDCEVSVAFTDSWPAPWIYLDASTQCVQDYWLLITCVLHEALEGGGGGGMIWIRYGTNGNQLIEYGDEDSWQEWAGKVKLNC